MGGPELLEQGDGGLGGVGRHSGMDAASLPSNVLHLFGVLWEAGGDAPMSCLSFPDSHHTALQLALAASSVSPTHETPAPFSHPCPFLLPLGTSLSLPLLVNAMCVLAAGGSGAAGKWG